MNSKKFEHRAVVIAGVLALASMNQLAVAQSTSGSRSTESQSSQSARTGKEEAKATKHVDEAVNVVQRMEKEPRMKELLQQAKGVFIVPSYGQAALGVGGSGGSGVLLVKKSDGTWTDPAFYNMGSVSIGAQAGAQGGALAMVLNNDKAVNGFKQKNNFSLDADAGLTVVDWEKQARGEVGAGDVVVWASNKGLFGNVVAVGVNDVRFNQELTNAYYRQNVAINEVLSGKVKSPQGDQLRQTLAAISGGPTTGGSEAEGASGSGKSSTSGASDTSGTSSSGKSGTSGESGTSGSSGTSKPSDQSGSSSQR